MIQYSIQICANVGSASEYIRRHVWKPDIRCRIH